MGKRSWTDGELVEAVRRSKSYRNVLKLLGLIPAGGNYVQIQYRIKALGLDMSHFAGKGWNKGLKYHTKTRPTIAELLVVGSAVQSFKLKKRLFEEGLKVPQCELCGWAGRSADGRIPVELDHINGNRNDNRIDNMQILCPNCHSLQPTHRGKNKKVHLARVLELGRQSTLKMSCPKGVRVRFPPRAPDCFCYHRYMAELKTKQQHSGVQDFLANIPDERVRQDCQIIADMLTRITGDPGDIWGTSIAGYDAYRYTYATGHEAEWCRLGFSPRKQNLTIYVMDGFGDKQDLLAKLGPHSLGKGCPYIKRLSDIDLKVLEDIVKRAYASKNHGEA
jgi:hypothetical protein